MSIKTILVHLAHDKDHTARLEVGVALGKRFGAHLKFLYVAHPIGIPAAVEGRGASWRYIAEAREIAREHAAEIKTELNAREELGAVSWELLIEEGEHVDLLAKHANYADLAIVSRAEAPTLESRLTTDLPHELPLVSPCPALILPRGMAHIRDIGKRILVAWSPTRESARAVRNALPFLAEAKSVLVVTVYPEDPDHVPDEEIGVFLERHGVRSQILDHMGDTDDIGGAILKTAADFHCDLVVMGGYEHSRLHDMILGSTTEAVLKQATLPILMSH